MLKIVQSSVQRRSHWNSTSFSFFWERIRLSLSTIHTAKRVIKMPCPKSPNITANRKGKVMMVYGARKKTEREPWATEKHGSPHAPLLSGLWGAHERLLPPCWMNGLSLREHSHSESHTLTEQLMGCVATTLAGCCTPSLQPRDSTLG